MNTVQEREAIRSRMEKILDKIPELPVQDVQNVRSLLDVGELLVAFETLCTQVYEWEISTNLDVIRELEDLGRLLGACATYVQCLWEDVKDV